MIEDEMKESTELDLRKLELQIEELIQACAYLKDENKSLRARQDSLVAERASLIEKTELARTRVEAMITRLKSMEAPQ
ncbi:MAG: TIGR02449 family protein [Chromatiales bacterium]